MRVRGGAVESELSTLVNPGAVIPARITMLTGITNAMVSLRREPGEVYHIRYEPVSLNDVDGKIVTLPERYINAEKDNILDSYLDYVSPLVRGNPNPFDEDGLLKLF